MKLPVFDMTANAVGSVEVSDQPIDVTPRRDVLHAVVVWQQQKRRAFAATTKTRSEVRGGGAKPWRQKGTGRARAGTRRSPLWRGGGVAHGPRGRRRVGRLPKKVRQLGLRMAIADRIEGEALKVVRGLQQDARKTKDAKQVLAAFETSPCLVLIADGREQSGCPSACERAFRNLPNARVMQVEGANVEDVLRSKLVLVAEEAVKPLWAKLSAPRVNRQEAA